MSTASKPADPHTPALLPKLIVSAGEPAGIGPDLCLWLAQQTYPAQITVAACLKTLQSRQAASSWVKQAITFSHGPATGAQQAGQLAVVDIATAESVTLGKPSAQNATHVLRLLDHAMQGCQQGDYHAMVTAPLQKSVINEAGIPFTGHTEYLADFFQAQTVMMLATQQLRVALATTHLPLRDVADAINRQDLTRTLRILHADLVNKFAITNPRILVCGLNPHAGESGHLGREEIEIINPVIQQLRAEGLNLSEAMPADTLFAQHHLQNADAVLAMYHDQGLPVLKHSGFGQAVNITLGLPIIRTSVDHGTALDLAGSNKINPGSLHAAIQSAIQQAKAQPLHE